MIEIHDITKRFGPKTAVNRLNLTVPSGQFFAFLGPNGAGKTTAIKVCVGLLHADEGAVQICGHDIQKEPTQAKALLSYVPDQPYLYDKLSAREFMEFIARMYKLNPQTSRKRIEELSEALSITDFMDDLAEGYSHGMKQRAVLAAALLHEPRVLIVDEPMVGLDPRSSRVVKDMLRDLAKRGTTVFMSTHVLDIAGELADRIGIIHHGQLVAVGTAEELRKTSGSAAGLEESFLRLTEEG